MEKDLELLSIDFETKVLAETRITDYLNSKFTLFICCKINLNFILALNYDGLEFALSYLARSIEYYILENYVLEIFLEENEPSLLCGKNLLLI